MKSFIILCIGLGVIFTKNVFAQSCSEQWYSIEKEIMKLNKVEQDSIIETLYRCIQAHDTAKNSAYFEIKYMYFKHLLNLPDASYARSFGQALYNECSLTESACGFRLKLLNQISFSFINSGNLDSAILFQEKAVEVSIELYGLNDRKTIILHNNLLSSYLIYLSDLEKSREMILKIEGIMPHKTEENKDLYGTFLLHKGTFFSKTGQFLNAENSLIEAEAILEQTNDFEGRNHVFTLLSFLYQKENYLEIALPYQKQSVQYFARKDTTTVDYASVLFKLATLYLSLDELDLAKDAFVTSIRIIQNHQGLDSKRIQPALYLWAKYNARRGDYETALEIIDKNLESMSKSLPESSLYWRKPWEFRASLYIENGDYQAADSLYNKIIEHIKKYTPEDLVWQMEIQTKQLISYYKQGNKAEAMNLASLNLKRLNSYVSTTIRYLSSEKRASFLYAAMDQYYLFYSILLQEAVEMDKNRVLEIFNSSNQLKTLMLNGAVIEQMKFRDSTFQDSLEILKNQYLAAFLKNESDEIGEISGQIDYLETKLLNKNYLLQKQQNKVTASFSEIQKKLGKNDAVVDIIRIPLQSALERDTVIYMAFIITEQTKDQPFIHFFYHSEDFDGILYNQYISLAKAPSVNFRNSNPYTNYWKPLEKYLNGIQNIYFSPSGVYNKINPNTLIDENGQYLIDKYAFHFLEYSGQLLEKNTKRDPIHNVVLFGGAADLKSGESRILPEVNLEINNIEKIVQQQGIKTEKYLYNQATEKNIKELVSPSILHIASHAVQDFEINEKIRAYRNGVASMMSAQIFLYKENDKAYPFTYDDGKLVAYEAQYLDLKKTDLVVLSACSTGTGWIHNGVGVFGLQRAFRIAGAKQVLVSLWPVPSIPTEKLMSLFYENYITYKMPTQDALKKAQQTLRKEYPAAYFWGAWVLTGN